MLCVRLKISINCLITRTGSEIVLKFRSWIWMKNVLYASVLIVIQWSYCNPTFFSIEFAGHTVRRHGKGVVLSQINYLLTLAASTLRIKYWLLFDKLKEMVGIELVFSWKFKFPASAHSISHRYGRRENDFRKNRDENIEIIENIKIFEPIKIAQTTEITDNFQMNKNIEILCHQINQNSIKCRDSQYY